MFVATLLLASLAATPVSPAPAPEADPTVGFLASYEQRQARLLEGLELAATFKPSEAPPLRLTDALRLGLADAPAPLDFGGGVSAQTRQLLALLLGFFVGFGTGHLIARDQDGFVLFLIVDAIIIAASSVLGWVVKGGLFWGLGGVALLISHIIQGLDAYAEAGGARIVERMRENAVWVADVGGSREPPVITTRAFALHF